MALSVRVGGVEVAVRERFNNNIIVRSLYFVPKNCAKIGAHCYW